MNDVNKAQLENILTIGERLEKIFKDCGKSLKPKGKETKTRVIELLTPLLPPECVIPTANAIMAGIPVVVAGMQGATGKTFLVDELCALGIHAIEEYDLSFRAKYSEKDYRYRNGTCVRIVLNRYIFKDSPVGRTITPYE